MSIHIAITDLPQNVELDAEAMSTLHGGYRRRLTKRFPRRPWPIVWPKPAPKPPVPRLPIPWTTGTGPTFPY